jgi:hypothetical protein
LAVGRFGARVHIPDLFPGWDPNAAVNQAAQYPGDPGVDRLPTHQRHGLSFNHAITDGRQAFDHALDWRSENPLLGLPVYTAWLTGVRFGTSSVNHPTQAVPAIGLNDRMTVNPRGETRSQSDDAGCIGDSGVKVALRHNSVHQRYRQQFSPAIRLWIYQHRDNPLIER